MALPDVSIILQNGGLGRIAPADDRVVALVVNGTPGTAYPVFSAEEALADPTNNTTFAPSFMQQIRDFFAVAGEGAELWVCPVDPALTTANLFLTGVLTAMMDQAEGRIVVVGISRQLVVETPTLVDGLHPDTLDGMDEAHAWAEQMAAQHRPCRVILDGKFLDPNLTNLRNLKSHTFNRVGICVSTIRPNSRNAAIGFLLGRIASSAVNINLGRLRDGETPTSQAYLTNTAVVRANSSQAIVLEQKGYIFLRKFPNKGGYYWVGDHMACADTDDFYSLANGRVADKVARLLYTNLLPELLDNVPVDVETGKIPATWVKNLQGKLDRAVSLGMITNGVAEISGVSTFLDPAQDILATSRLEVRCRVTPLGLARDIDVILGFYNPNA